MEGWNSSFENLSQWDSYLCLFPLLRLSVSSFSLKFITPFKVKICDLMRNGYCLLILRPYPAESLQRQMCGQVSNTFTQIFLFLQTPKSCLGSPSYQMCSFLSQHCLTGSLAHTPATKAIGDLLGHTSYHLKCSFYVLLEVHIPKACSYPQQLFVLIIPGTTRPTIGLFVFFRDGDLKMKKRTQSSAPQTSASIQTWVIR